MYAFAIILWELSHWEQAYKNIGSGEIREAVRSGGRMALNVSEEISSLILKAITFNTLN